MLWSYLQSWRLLMLVLLTGMALSAQAREHLDVRPVGDFVFGSWTRSGSLQLARLHCLASADTPKTSQWNKNDSTVRYSLVMESTSQASSFNLYPDGVFTNEPTQRLRIRIFHEDIAGGGGREELFPATRENHLHTGQFFGCPNGANSRVTVAIDAVDLAAVRSGNYREVFRMTASNADAVVSVLFTVSVTVDNGGVVQVSRLNTVAFGTHAGLGDITGSELFCVHSAALNNRYTLRISPARGSAAAFTLVASSGGDVIPLSVAFAAGGGTATSVAPATAVQGIGSPQPGCNSTDNARLDFRLLEADLQAASSGRYTQTLVVLVEPI